MHSTIINDFITFNKNQYSKYILLIIYTSHHLYLIYLYINIILCIYIYIYIYIYKDHYDEKYIFNVKNLLIFISIIFFNFSILR
jgi:hypothetical protein